MKRCLILLYLLASFLFAAADNVAIKNSLKEALQQASSTEQRLETLTNLMDIHRQQEQVDYAKLLYKEALAADNDYYKEAALTEILRFYINNDVKDSAHVYMAEAKQQLKGKARDFLVTYMQTILDVRVVYYTQGEERKKLIEQYKLRLETEKDLSPLEKMAINYLIGMAYSNRIEPGNEVALSKLIGTYFKNVLVISEKMPLQYTYLFRLNTLNVLALFSDPEYQAKYSLQYLNMQKEYANREEMQKRPYVSKRHLLNAYSTLALSAPTFGNDLATFYYNQFLDLNQKYPEDAGFSAQYDRYFTSLNYYRHIRNYRKVVDYCDSVIHYFNHSDIKMDFTEHIASTLLEKAEGLDSLHLYKEAYETHKEYASLQDSTWTKKMQNQLEDLEIKKRVDELVIEKKELEVELQNSQNQLYLFLALFILAICAAIYVFFRLGKVKALYRELQESNQQVIIASEKAQESERMKNAFIKNICHEVRTPLNAINGFAELVTSEDIELEEKKEFSKIIFENCNSITSMMNDILIIAQLDSSKDSLPLKPVHINLLCQHEMEKAKKKLLKPSIGYQVKGNPDEDLIYSDPGHFSLIISHLLNNANKFTEQGNITLEYHMEDENRTMCISVTDTGCGIPIDKSEWVFDRFTKNDEFIPGSGLGLYLCRLVAQRLSGSIRLDTEYTGGSRFVLKLPINQYA